MLGYLKRLRHARFSSESPLSMIGALQSSTPEIKSIACPQKVTIRHRVVLSTEPKLRGVGDSYTFFTGTSNHAGVAANSFKHISCNSSATSRFATFATSKEKTFVTLEKQGGMQAASIKCRGDIADGMAEALLCFGANSCSIEDAHLGGLREQEMYAGAPWLDGPRRLWEESHITAIFPEEQDVGEAIAMASHSIGINQMPQYKIEIMEDQEWLQQLQNVFEPLEVATGLWIVPRWTAPPDPAAVNVMLEPGLAFGTGEHPTTRLCLKWLHRIVKGGESVMDYGVGSGILSIAALKMGAAKAVGVDVDPMAISSTTSNALLNSIEDHRLEVFLSDVNGGDPVPAGAARHDYPEEPIDSGKSIDSRKSSEFDIIVANILANPLMELANRITSYGRPGSLVGVSGLLVEQVDQVRRTYMEYLDNVRVSHDSGWACITGTIKMPQ